MDPNLTPVAVPTFRDALGLAMQLADEYAFVNAAALVGGDAQVLDLAVAEGIGRSVGPLVDWLVASPAWPSPALRARATGVLLVTVRPFEAEVVREADLRCYRRCRWSLAMAGNPLLDWIETDGDLVRSYAYTTCPAEAWPGDPPAQRPCDGRPF